MLPDFPTIKKKRHERLLHSANFLSRQLRPPLGQIKTVIQHEGVDMHATSEDGFVQSDGYEKFEESLSLELKDLPCLTDEKWLEILRRITDAFATKQMKQMFCRMDEATESSGNVVSANGKPLSVDLVLEGLEKVEIPFEDGEISPTFQVIAGTDMHAKLTELMGSDEFRKQWDEIIDRKFAEWRAREADRKLVD